MEVTPARIRVRQTEALCTEEDAQLCGFSNEISEKTFSKNEQLKNLIREANRTLEKNRRYVNYILSTNVLLAGIRTSVPGAWSNLNFLFLISFLFLFPRVFPSLDLDLVVPTGTVPGYRGVSVVDLHSFDADLDLAFLF